MIIGFFGVQCGSTNKGVSALAYSAISIFNSVISKDAKFIIFSSDSNDDIETMKRSLGIVNKEIIAFKHSNRKLSSIRDLYNQIKMCDLIIDFTGGDSFSDIYGARRLLSGLLNKQMVISSGVKFVLAPQTYGPFYRKSIRPWVKHIINKSDCIFLRDKKSVSVLESMTKKPLRVVTDIAFYLTYDSKLYSFQHTMKKRIGINISGLLWNGGYTTNNQFNLKTNYKKFCMDLIDKLINNNVYEVYLIPHVVSNKSNSIESDTNVSKQIQAIYKKCIIAPDFTTPVEAKSFISNMDILLGARMHATIAAFSSNVPTVPIAYSRKFSGLFENLGYDKLVDLTKLNTKQAVELSLEYIKEVDTMKESVMEGNVNAKEKLNSFIELISEVVNKC